MMLLPGAVSQRGSGQRCHDWRGACPKRPPGNELPRLSPEETLAERQVPPCQVLHGQSLSDVLIVLEMHIFLKHVNVYFMKWWRNEVLDLCQLTIKLVILGWYWGLNNTEQKKNLIRKIFFFSLHCTTYHAIPYKQHLKHRMLGDQNLLWNCFPAEFQFIYCMWDIYCVLTTFQIFKVFSEHKLQVTKGWVNTEASLKSIDLVI